MEERLKFIFSNVNDWLKFAEGKLAGIIVFNGAILIGIMQISKELGMIDWHIKNAIIVQIYSNIISLLVSFWGILPKIKRNKLNNKNQYQNDNLIFWGDISKYDVDSFTQKFRTDFQYQEEPTAFEQRIIEQIIQNSKLNVRKNKLFKASLYITLIGLVISLVFLL